jgi:hypothetical protein
MVEVYSVADQYAAGDIDSSPCSAMLPKLTPEHRLHNIDGRFLIRGVTHRTVTGEPVGAFGCDSRLKTL